MLLTLFAGGVILDVEFRTCIELSCNGLGVWEPWLEPLSAGRFVPALPTAGSPFRVQAEAPTVELPTPPRHVLCRRCAFSSIQPFTWPVRHLPAEPAFPNAAAGCTIIIEAVHNSKPEENMLETTLTLMGIFSCIFEKSTLSTLKYNSS